MDSGLSRVLKVNPERPEDSAVREAAECLARGGLLILPTDTVYGLAADPRVPGAEDRLYEAKRRPAEKAIPRLASDARQVSGSGAVLGGKGRRLAERYWPGPLTLVLAVPGGTCGFRVPDHATCLAVLRAVGAPLAVTSANLSGAPEARTAEDAVRSLCEQVELALDAGPAPGGVASSVVRVIGEHVEILREGAISGPELLKTAEG